MATKYPGASDNFPVPSQPSVTPLQSSGDSTRNHWEHHRDLGDAVQAIQANVALKNHDHSGTGSRATPKLSQANTHQNADTDSSASAIHHTLGKGQYQASPGNHNHDGFNSLMIPQSSVVGLTDDLNNLRGSAVYRPFTSQLIEKTTVASSTSAKVEVIKSGAFSVDGNTKIKVTYSWPGIRMPNTVVTTAYMHVDMYDNDVLVTRWQLFQGYSTKLLHSSGSQAISWIPSAGTHTVRIYFTPYNTNSQVMELYGSATSKQFLIVQPLY